MKEKQFQLTKRLDHIAFIMDGNGRWANAKGLPRHLGHKKACTQLIKIIKLVDKLGIKCMSFFAFSTENWNRPKEEIDHLFDYLEEFFKKNINELLENNTKIIVSGDLSRLRQSSKDACLDAINRSKDNKGSIINICLNYGGRDDIVKATKKIAILVKEDKLDLHSINEETFKDYLYTAGLPDVDLLIRTSGEERISNFLLYQIAYAELVFADVNWPDFGKNELIACLKEYNGRSRRHGGLVNE